ncbi:hypothetical protein POL68_21520 [Stigmatella sp. ncwal1]|uniref:HEXXH motif-containing protein n=1 Tax=Stigmatella ashevillensis TaxID=2995309 RepID=A0ABT5DD52_9BACT|nr:hypothetical protein [Stigmatella ashevillena]MDC0711065.1 hypothetical protein [Stigmatella ashevillena]
MDLITLFQWQKREEAQAALAALNRRYLQRLSGRLNGVLATQDESGAGDPELDMARLRSRFRELPDKEFLRLVRAPETCYQLSRVSVDGLLPFKKYMWASIEAERQRLDPSAPLRENIWSALGDLYCPAKTGPRGSAERPYHATRLHGQIVLDFLSPRATRDLEKNSFRPKPYGPAEPFTPEEHRSVCAKTEEAMDGIREVSPAAYDFVHQTVSVLIPRKQTHADFYPTSFKGSSSRVHIGRSNIFNVQFDYIDSTNVAQSIVHEAIHNHLYKVEEENSLIHDAQAADQARLLSPWTGNSINLVAFVHGTIVFYAIFHFFRLPLASRYFSSKHLQYYVDQAVQGFRERRMSQCLEPCRRYLQPRAYEQLEAMEADVMQAV